MRILLTGATGFLGHHLLPELLKEGYSLTITKRGNSNIERIEKYISQISCFDIDKTDLRSLFNDEDITTVIHLASNYGRMEDDRIEDVIRANVTFPSILLDAGTRKGLKVFVNADTALESDYLPYAATKKAFSKISDYYVSAYDLTFINMKLHLFYGEGDDGRKFIPRVITSILKEEELKTTQGMQKRDFIYVKDVVNAYQNVLQRLDSFREGLTELEIGSGVSISLRELVGIIEGITGKRGNISWGELPYRKNEVFEYIADISLARKLLGWHPRFSIEEGLRRTIGWYERKIV